jgi:hypothetical protein
MGKFCRAGLPVTTCVVLLTLAACTRQGQDEMSWARAALERNHDIEVVAADPRNRTFTVRMKDTGELRMVRADEVIAAPASPPASASATAPAQTMSAETPSAQAMSAQAMSAQAMSAQTAPPGAPTAGNATPAAASAAEESVEGAQSGEAPPATQPSSLVPQTALAASARRGKVLESGPGYSIQSAAAEAPAANGRVRETNVTNAPLERRHDPIICQGSRMMHIDNRNLAFDGDAVSAEDGCEIHITNSHISAGGIGVLARAANVHIDNSLIEGEQGSIDASDGAQVYIATSRFRGLSRRLDSAALHDLGGNVWN